MLSQAGLLITGKPTSLNYDERRYDGRLFLVQVNIKMDQDKKMHSFTHMPAEGEDTWCFWPFKFS